MATKTLTSDQCEIGVDSPFHSYLDDGATVEWTMHLEYQRTDNGHAVIAWNNVNGIECIFSPKEILEEYRDRGEPRVVRSLQRKIKEASRRFAPDLDRER